MPTTARSDLAAGMATMLAAFIVANPTRLRKFLTAKPESFTQPLPLAYLSARPEVITHAAGTRARVFSPSVTVVFPFATNKAEMDVADDTVDLLVDHFTTYPHIVTGTIWDAMTVEDDREDISDSSSLPSVRFTFTNISIREGRT